MKEIRSAEDLLNEFPPKYDDFYSPDEVFELIQQFQPEGDGWVKCSDMLPEFGGDYNVVLELNDGGEPVSGIMEFDGVHKKWLYPGTDCLCSDVTHWRELPQPPLPKAPKQ